MKISIEIINGVTVVQIVSENLDASNVVEFKNSTAPILDQSKQVIFDMRELRFVDSSGLGAIISSLRKLNAAGGDLKLFGMNKSVRALFELVRMHRIFDILNTQEEALRAFENN